MYRDEIFCLEDASYKTVGEWLKSAMKTSGLKRADLVFNLNKNHEVGEPGKGIDPTFISAITSGREKIPERYIPAFCQSLGLSKPVARYYAAEILRVNLPRELEDCVIRPMRAAKEQAIETALSKELGRLEKGRAEAHKRFDVRGNDYDDNDLKFFKAAGISVSRSHEDVDKFYDQLIIRAKQSLHGLMPSISATHERPVSLQASMNAALDGRPLSLSVFFNKDLKPVSDMVAMARLYRYFDAHNSDDNVTFEKVIEAISIREMLQENRSAFSWLTCLSKFLERSGGPSSKALQKILASETEPALDFESLSNWHCEREWSWIEWRLLREGLTQVQLEINKQHFFANYITSDNERRFKAIRVCLSDLSEEGYMDALDDLRSHEQYDDDFFDFVVMEEKRNDEGKLVSRSLRGKTHITEVYLSGLLQKYLSGE